MIIDFLSDVFRATKHFLSQQFHLTKLKKFNPTCIFSSGVQIEHVKFGHYNVIFENVRMSNCKIGSHTYIQKESSIFNAIIGKFCSIATHVSIGPGKHKMDSVSTHPAFYLKNTPLAKTFVSEDLFQSFTRTTIGNDVWIGERSIILDGVNIGNGAIIAAGSIVTKDVLPYAIVGGTPAKLIRFRFSTDVIEKIENSEWWLKSDEELQKMSSLMLNIDLFIKKN